MPQCATRRGVGAYSGKPTGARVAPTMEGPMFGGLRCSGVTMTLALALLAGTADNARAQSYPAKPVRVIFPFPPGGPTDLLRRAVAQKLSGQTGHQFIAGTGAGTGGHL